MGYFLGSGHHKAKLLLFQLGHIFFFFFIWKGNREITGEVLNESSG